VLSASMQMFLAGIKKSVPGVVQGKDRQLGRKVRKPPDPLTLLKTKLADFQAEFQNGYSSSSRRRRNAPAPARCVPRYARRTLDSQSGGSFGNDGKAETMTKMPISSSRFEKRMAEPCHHNDWKDGGGDSRTS